MIPLSQNKVALTNLDGTIEALETLDYLINTYSENKPGPAYCSFDYVAIEHSEVQFDRSVVVKALESQKSKLVEYLASLGIDANS